MTEIAVAAVAAVGAVIVAMIEAVRRQNTREHGETGTKIDNLGYTLGKIDASIAAVHDKVDNHLDDHRSRNT